MKKRGRLVLPVVQITPKTDAQLRAIARHIEVNGTIYNRRSMYADFQAAKKLR